MEGTARLRPEVVAEVRRTAWNQRGVLKRMAVDGGGRVSVLWF